jgi:DNA replication protein DnaC
MSVISSTPPGPEDWAEAQRRQRREADRQWLAGIRPPVFDYPGEPDPAVAKWIGDLLADRHAAGNLVLTGSVGRLKTWTIWKIVEACVEAGHARKVEVVKAYELRRVITPPVDFARLDKLARVPLLCLDDLGSDSVSEWDLRYLFEIVDQRSEWLDPVVISSNVLDLRVLFGERIASRLATKVVIVELAGEDRRRSA